MTRRRPPARPIHHTLVVVNKAGRILCIGGSFPTIGRASHYLSRRMRAQCAWEDWALARCFPSGTQQAVEGWADIYQYAINARRFSPLSLWKNPWEHPND